MSLSLRFYGISKCIEFLETLSNNSLFTLDSYKLIESYELLMHCNGRPTMGMTQQTKLTSTSQAIAKYS